MSRSSLRHYSRLVKPRSLEGTAMTDGERTCVTASRADTSSTFSGKVRALRNYSNAGQYADLAIVIAA